MSNTISENTLGGRFTFPGTSLTVHRIGYGAMKLSGTGVWGPPKAPDAAVAILREAVAAGANLQPKPRPRISRARETNPMSTDNFPLTRERILATAEDVVRKFGPAKATVVDVARALGVSHAAVYRHVASKAELRALVVSRWVASGAVPSTSSISRANALGMTTATLPPSFFTVATIPPPE
jgi:DNA-binding transcriptional ArsR family regulator